MLQLEAEVIPAGGQAREGLALSAKKTSEPRRAPEHAPQSTSGCSLSAGPRSASDADRRRREWKAWIRRRSAATRTPRAIRAGRRRHSSPTRRAARAHYHGYKNSILTCRQVRTVLAVEHIARKLGIRDNPAEPAASSSDFPASRGLAPSARRACTAEQCRRWLTSTRAPSARASFLDNIPTTPAHLDGVVRVSVEDKAPSSHACISPMVRIFHGCGRRKEDEASGQGRRRYAAGDRSSRAARRACPTPRSPAPYRH